MLIIDSGLFEKLAHDFPELGKKKKNCIPIDLQ